MKDDARSLPKAGWKQQEKQGDTVINVIKTPRGIFAGTLDDIEAYIADREREHNEKLENLMAGYSALQEEYAEVKA